MRDQYMRCGEGFMICYSVTDKHSFQEAVEYRKLINKVRASEDIPLVLIGNKFDLQQQRKVTPEEGRALAAQFGCPFYETSAALRHYVDDAFHTLVREIRLKERERHQTANKLHKHSRWRSVIFAMASQLAKNKQEKLETVPASMVGVVGHPKFQALNRASKSPGMSGEYL
ncbi:unnamed protein product, partial [Timema podura]|nr:unnamed protein product [Timema podura]